MAKSCLLSRTESTATTELSRSNYTFVWKISNFDVICPPDCEEFEMMKSPCFKAAEDIGNGSAWIVHMSGISKHIACYLQLEGVVQEGRKKQTHVTCSFKIHFGNEDNRQCFTRSISAHKFTKENNDWGYSKFISIAELYERKNTLLVNNTLQICVHMEIYGDTVTHHPQPLKRKMLDKTLETFSADFNDLLQNQKYTDFQIICGEKSFYAHKLILSARSKVFRAMFESDMEEAEKREVEIADIDSDTVQMMLHYIYTGKVIVPESGSWTETIYAAEKYDLPELKNYCFDKMLECVTDNTVGVLAVAAYTYNATPETQEIIKKYCQSNIVTLMKDAAFKKLLKSHPGAFF